MAKASLRLTVVLQLPYGNENRYQLDCVAQVLNALIEGTEMGDVAVLRSKSACELGIYRKSAHKGLNAESGSLTHIFEPWERSRIHTRANSSPNFYKSPSTGCSRVMLGLVDAVPPNVSIEQTVNDLQQAIALGQARDVMAYLHQHAETIIRAFCASPVASNIADFNALAATGATIFILAYLASNTYGFTAAEAQQNADLLDRLRQGIKDAVMTHGKAVKQLVTQLPPTINGSRLRTLEDAIEQNQNMWRAAKKCQACQRGRGGLVRFAQTLAEFNDRLQLMQTAAMTAALQPSLQSLSQHVESFATRAKVSVSILGLNAATAALNAAGERHIGKKPLDLDEGIHSLKALLDAVIKAINSGDPRALIQHLEEEAELIATQPLTALSEHAVASGVADFSVVASLSAMVFVLSGMAIQAGIEEWKGALEQEKLLSMVQDALRERVEQRFKAVKANIENAQDMTPEQRKTALIKLAEKCRENDQNWRIARECLCLHQRGDDLAFARKVNHFNKRIAQFTLLSGLGIFGKSMMELLMQIASIGTTGKMNVAEMVVSGAASGALGMASTIIGCIATFFAGPIAAAGAIGLGIYFVRKTYRELCKLIEDKKQLDDFCNGIKNLDPVRYPELGRYLEYVNFLEIKGDHREKVLRRFLKWNIAFLIGSALYGLSTAAKAGLFGTALAVGLSSFVGTAIVAGTILAGGLIMLASSWQFLHGHGDQVRIEGYQYQDDEEIDRHFLASIDLFLDAYQDKSPMLQGVQLRHECLESITLQDQWRQACLQAIAGIGKHENAWKMHSHVTAMTDLFKDIPHDLPTSFSWARYCHARAGAIKRFFGELRANGSWGQAYREAANVFSEARNRVTGVRLEQLLNDPETMRYQLVCMEEVTKAQQHYLQSKGIVRARALGDVIAQETEQIERDNSTIAQSQEKDEMQLQKCQELLVMLDALRANCNQHTAIDALAGAHRKFLQLQRVLPDVPDSDLPHADCLQAFAAWLRADQFTDWRGILFETQLQALKLRAMMPEIQFTPQPALLNISPADAEDLLAAEGDPAPLSDKYDVVVVRRLQEELIAACQKGAVLKASQKTTELLDVLAQQQRRVRPATLEALTAAAANAADYDEMKCILTVLERLQKRLPKRPLRPLERLKKTHPDRARARKAEVRQHVVSSANELNKVRMRCEREGDLVNVRKIDRLIKRVNQIEMGDGVKQAAAPAPEKQKRAA